MDAPAYLAQVHLEVPPCYPYEEAVICLTFRLMRLFAIQPRQVSKMDLPEPLAGQSCNHVGHVFGNTVGTACQANLESPVIQIASPDLSLRAATLDPSSLPTTKIASHPMLMLTRA